MAGPSRAAAAMAVAVSVVRVGLCACVADSHATPTTSAYWQWMARQNRRFREALAAEYSALPENRTWISVKEYQSLMSHNNNATGRRRARWRDISHGGYCLVPATQRTYISPGNPLAVGHKLPEQGLLTAVRMALPHGSRVLELGGGQGELKMHMRGARPDLSWHAVDGALNVESYTRELVQYFDVCGPWPPEWNSDAPRGGGFDYIVSIEMAEHIDRSCEANFVNLLKQARRGLVLSWAWSYLEDVVKAEGPKRGEAPSSRVAHFLARMLQRRMITHTLCALGSVCALCVLSAHQSQNREAGGSPPRSRRLCV